MWTGATTYYGYGVIQKGGAHGGLVRAHRVSWELHHGPIPKGLNICHACDNPPCVNPDHLFLGDQKVNMSDCSAKGRARGGSPPGSKHHQAKLTETHVTAIRHAYTAGGTSHRRLAAEYGVSRKSISNIIHHRSWTHV